MRRLWLLLLALLLPPLALWLDGQTRAASINALLCAAGVAVMVALAAGPGILLTLLAWPHAIGTLLLRRGAVPA